MTSTPPTSSTSGAGLPKRRRGESLRATRPAPPVQAPAPTQPVTPGQPPASAGPARATPPGGAAPPAFGDPGDQVTDRTSRPAPSAAPSWFTPPPTAHQPAVTPADPAAGRTGQPPRTDLTWPTTATTPAAANPADQATGLTRRPAPTESTSSGPAAMTGGPGAAQPDTGPGRPGRPEPAAPALTLPPPAPERPVRRRAAPVSAGRRLANAALGIALLAAAVALQTTVLSADERISPITSSGTAGELVHTAFFGARVESVEVARALQEENRDRVDPAPGQVFLVVTVRATGKTRALQLQRAELVTADGLTYEATERILPTRTLAHRWVQPMLWSSGPVFFEVPPEALPGARVVVSERKHALFGDQYLAEASIDLGLDAAKAKAAVDSATGVYRIPTS